MKLPEKEKAAQKAAFRAMTLPQKAEHIYLYYKWPILLGLIALIVLGSVVQQQFTRKDAVLSVAFANVAVGEALESDLTDGFLRFLGADAKKREVYLYRDLYLSDNADTLNHEYAYASKMKLMGAIKAQRLDVVLMNREAYDLLSRSGYLLELSPALFTENAALYTQILPFLSSNEVVLSDNSIKYQLGEAETLEVETETVRNALDVSGLPLFARAGFPDTVYIGVIANSGRLANCIEFVSYVSGS